ncbi:BBS12 protein, partial [Nothoprocta pentlandii]|nr:BBS12 protein [Nothoprocta pentlandii]
LAMAFREMTARRHVGLEQLSAFALAGRTLLGPVKSCKFVVDESTNQSILTCSAVRLIESLDLSSATGQLLNETIQAQNKEFKTGMSSLLFLVGAWSNAVLECLEQNVPVSVIVSVMAEGLNSCCEKVQCLQRSIHDVNKELCSNSARTSDFEKKTFRIRSNSLLNPQVCFQKGISASEELAVARSVHSHPEDSCNFSTSCSVSTLSNFGSVASLIKLRDDESKSVVSGSGIITSNCNKKKLSHSRYFSTLAKSNSSSQLSNWEGYLSGQSAYPCECNGFGHLAMALSHGNATSLKLLQNIVAYRKQQAECKGSSQLDVTEIVTCCLLGLPESYSCVCPGFITLVSPEQASIIKYLQEKPLGILLMDGDLTEQYRHLGFNRPRNVRTISEQPSLQEGSPGDAWLCSALDILTRFEVNLILVKGNVCEKLMERCLANNILVIGSVKPHVLHAFEDASGAQAVQYLAQLHARYIGHGAHVQLWRACDGRAMELRELVPVRIDVQGIPLLTAVLTTTVAAKLQLIEDRFWTFVYRLHHALDEGRVFLGGGAVELLCLSHTRMLAEESLTPARTDTEKEFHNASWLAASLTECKSVVLQALGSGWIQYLSTVLCNTAKAASGFEARALIECHLKRAADCGSPSAYILKEFRRGGLVQGASDPFTDPAEGFSVYDNVAAKVEAWRRALDLVLLVLQTDAEIIMGPERNRLLNSDVSSEFVFL